VKPVYTTKENSKRKPYTKELLLQPKIQLGSRRTQSYAPARNTTKEEGNTPGVKTPASLKTMVLATQCK